jgi:uncharacterized protein (TIGR02145 family)
MKIRKSVVIGTQEWMGRNLNVRRFRNGDPVSLVSSGEEWAAAAVKKLPACCFFENMKWIGSSYGKLYNWYAVNDPRGLAPEGWHIPSEREWDQLAEFCGGHEIAGTKLKSKKEWEDPCGTNESRFNALPGSFRKPDGEFKGIEDDNNWWKCFGYWWTSTEHGASAAWERSIRDYNGYIYREFADRGYGFSVRCIKGS